MIRELVARAFRRACLSQMPDFAADRNSGEPHFVSGGLGERRPLDLHLGVGMLRIRRRCGQCAQGAAVNV